MNFILNDGATPPDTELVIDQFKNSIVKKLCTLLSAVISGKLHFRTLLTSLTPEDIAFINKNVMGKWEDVGIDIDALDEKEKIVISQNEVSLRISRDEIRKNLGATMSEESHKVIEDMISAGKGGSFQNLVKQLKDHLTAQNNNNVVRTTNLNAYEIRLQILKEATNIAGKQGTDKILQVAEELYRFVEGPKRK